MRQFYSIYVQDEISQTLSDQFTYLPKASNGRQFYLSWSHYLKLMRIDNTDERHFYEIEAIKNDWSLSELQRQFDSALFERLVLSKDKEEVERLSKEGQIIEKSSDIVKDPYILEFLGLSELPEYSESEMENKIIDHLQQFLMELGRGFTFVGRQVRFTFDEEHFRVDLVFFNRILRSFVLIDLKIGELKHQDIGQMQMYVNYYDRNVKLDDENPTGIAMVNTLEEAFENFANKKFKDEGPKSEKIRRLSSTNKENKKTVRKKVSKALSDFSDKERFEPFIQHTDSKDAFNEMMGVAIGTTDNHE